MPLFTFEKDVRESIDKQLNLFPESRLQDLYKNFFQDRFGPEHLISNTSVAENYLTHELSSYTKPYYPLMEEIGWEGNFYRISLDFIKMDAIPYQTFLDAFIESANSTHRTTIEEWEKEWNQILSIIEQIKLDLPDYESDKTNIRILLDSGNYAMHHSKVFEKLYHPHYRIIRRDIFDSIKDVKQLQ